MCTWSRERGVRPWSVLPASVRKVTDVTLARGEHLNSIGPRNSISAPSAGTTCTSHPHDPSSSSSSRLLLSHLPGTLPTETLRLPPPLPANSVKPAPTALSSRTISRQTPREPL